MALLFEYKPGMSLTDPWVFTTTRAQSAYFIDSTGKLVLAGANVLRDRHYPFGLGSAIRTMLMEPASVNSCLQSQALNTSPWVPNLATVANSVTTAPDGTATGCSIVPDGTSSSNHRDSQLLTITSNEFIALSGFFKTKGYAGLHFRMSDNAGTNSFGITVDVTNGTNSNNTNGAGTVTGRVVVPLANGWYWVAVWGSINAAVTAAGVYANVFDTYANATTFTAYSGDSSSGIYAWGLQIERWGATAGAISPATSYMATGAGTASRALDSVTTPWPYQTMPMWCYTKAIDLGGSVRGPFIGSGTLAHMSSAGSLDPQWLAHFHRNNGAPGASWISGCGPGSPGSTNRNTVPSALFPAPYDTVETFSRVFISGATNFAVRVNGGAVSVSGQVGPTGGIPFADLAAPTLLRFGPVLGSTGTLDGILVVRIGADPTRITTLDQAVAA